MGDGSNEIAAGPRAAVRPSPAEIAEWTGGELMDAGDAPAALEGIGTLDRALPGELSFAASPKLASAAAASRAGLLLVPPGFDAPGRARVEVADVWSALAEVMRRLYPEPRPAPGVHPSAVVASGARLGADVHVGPCAVVGESAEIGDGAAIGPHCFVDEGCRVGAGSRLHAGVKLYGPVEIGARCLIHAGAVFGADGFKFERVPTGIAKIPQVGRIVIEDDVEIGANSSVDRAFLYETRIGAGTKIDNLVQIGHNVSIGRRCLIAAGCAFGGSVTIEDDCMIGGHAAFAPGVRLGRGSAVGGGSGLSKDFPPGSAVRGVPAEPMRNHLRGLALLRRMPKLIDRVQSVEERLALIEDDEKGGA